MHILYPNKLEYRLQCEVYVLYLCSFMINYNLTYQYGRLLRRYLMYDLYKVLFCYIHFYEDF